MTRFSPLLRWRMAKGWGTRQAAAHLETNQASYCRWESGAVLPRPLMLKRIIRRTGVAGMAIVQYWLSRKHRQKADKTRATASPSVVAE